MPAGPPCPFFPVSRVTRCLNVPSPRRCPALPGVALCPLLLLPTPCRPSSLGKAKARRAEAEPSPGPVWAAPGPHRDCTGTVPGPHRDRAGTVLGPCRDLTGTAPGPCRDRTGTAPGPCRDRAGTTMASISSFLRRSLRRAGRREGKDGASAAENATPQVPQGKLGERSSLFCSAGQFFFEYLVVVSLKKTPDGHYEPKITYQFPKRENLLKGQKEEEERLLQAIPLFCFPDGNNWLPVTEFSSETFSFVLTNVDGSRKIGYCRRLLPSGRGVRLPEVFCIISCLGCFGLFSKILDEVEKRRQISMAVIYPFMQGLRESPFPAPGKTVTVKSFIPESGTELIELTRPVDAHLEHVEFQALLQRLSPHLILHIFASATLERRLIFLAEELSVLSQCIHAVAALLYPFTWAHTYIPVVPECLLDTVCCPTPFMVGIQMRHLQRVLEQPMEEVGDEEEILPGKLQNEMLTSLNRHNNNNNEHTSEQLNALVSEAFVHFFVRLLGHYSSHIKWGRSGSGSFQERAFCKAIPSKSCRRFLKKFVKTNMFSLFIEEAEKSRIPQEAYFQQKIKEYHEQKKHRRDS
ncbi:DENN domain-containing protein 2D isoform X2 [Parus major]|uniref:DENN domain-containing protein 2D isoform X2 n=1 Tax=Parus major TaxID=9157 RepID=UPI001443FEF6|nr:DENN domain-containing protein 2D isoform X2 [Parus major]